MKQPLVLILFLFLAFQSRTQEPLYFNKTYQNNFSDISGNSIIEIQDGYLGFGAVHFPNITGQYLIFIYIDKYGNEITWTPFGEEYHNYYPGSGGGKLIQTNDGNLAIAFHIADSESVYGCLFKFTQDLDTIWKMHYNTEADWTVIQNCSQTSDNGFILTGEIFQDQYSDLILLKTDSLGNEEWHQFYGTNWSEKGRNVIQTPDGGYLIGGYFWKPGYDHSLDAMVIKTDSLGNEEWTQYYGNPDVDDDMALVAMADDGNYLVATVYGEWIHTSMIRTGRLYLVKIDNDGNTIWDKKIGPKRRSINLKNFRHTLDENMVATGWSYTDTISEWIYDGWIYKFTQEGDSIWWRDYYHYHNQYDRNFFYDVSPTSDKGYIAIGKARPDQGGSTNKMWIVKVDSMGCDTPGCITTVIPELSPSVRGQGEVKVWPNPTNSKFEVRSLKFEVAGNKIIRVYNSQGLKVEDIEVPKGKETIVVNVQGWTKGMYFVQLVVDGEAVGSEKIIRN
ncbi:MAG: T9SS type A sorting domain-containing protein [Bacteroidales bacterium]|nr:T9SS type A sorting domain-containing protein [Bacteroidales bacterium]